MVSADDTIKIMATEAMAPRLNSGLNGNKCGKAMIPPEKIMLKSTFPKRIATRYPTIRPASTESCLIYPFAKIFHARQVSKVTPAMIRF